jgi:hypothetical protein
MMSTTLTGLLLGRVLISRIFIIVQGCTSDGIIHLLRKMQGEGAGTDQVSAVLPFLEHLLPEN